MAIVKSITGEAFECGANETIVRAALRNGLGFPYECNSGSCGTCKFTVVSGEFDNLYVGAPGLSERDVKKGRLLGCQCSPVGDVEIKANFDVIYKPVFEPKSQRAKLVNVKKITHDISEFSFEVECGDRFVGGQYSLIAIPGLGKRAYSMSNTPNSNRLDFMVKKTNKNGVSDYLFDLKVGDKESTLDVDGPYGIAYYRESPRDKICLAGGSGLAPMVSIAREHLASGSKSKMTFLMGGRTDSDLLWLHEFRELVGDDDGVIEYYPVASENTLANNVISGFLHEALSSVFGNDLQEFDIYCAGPPALTSSLELMLHNNNFPINQLYFDRYC